VDSLPLKELQVLKQDSYINDLDTNAGEISQNRINMFYCTETDTNNDYYSCSGSKAYVEKYGCRRHQFATFDL
jgi:hypothetical protein